jgi:hypothetical protein
MSTQIEIPLPVPYRIKSALGPRNIALSSLRPGDWLETSTCCNVVVIRNWAAVQRIEVRWADGNLTVHDHDIFIQALNPSLVGHGKRRPWHPLLPKWAQKWVSPFGRPRK